MSERISIVINGDTRPGLYESMSSLEDSMLGGTKSFDFLKEGTDNKLKFFDGYEIDSTLFIDVHEPLAMNDMRILSQKVDNLVLHKHRETFEERPYFPFHIDLNFWEALTLARGEYVVHFDWETAAFKNEGSGVVETWLSWLKEGKYDYISYPSPYSPRATTDPKFTYDWASTRFFLCRKDTLDYTEILKCLRDNDYMYEKYEPKDNQGRCGWLEHVLGLIAGPGRVFYPPMNINDHMVFSWSKYVNGVLGKLNGMSYRNVLKYVLGCNGIQYPCDVAGRAI